MDSKSEERSGRSDTSDVNIIEKYCKYLNRKVLLKTTKSSHLGSLKCIDPLTQTIALIVTDSDTNQTKLIIAMSHSIKSIELIDENDINCDQNSDELVINLKRFLSNSMNESNDKIFSEQELNERKENVIQWLKKNRIPCEESNDGSLCIAYALTLNPPFGREECICGNEMVLRQIQTLLDSMPQ